MTATTPAERPSTPIDRLVSLRLLAHAVDAAVTAAEAEAHEFRRLTGSKSFTPKAGGTVSLTERKPTIKFDDGRLVEWAEEHAPHLITPTLSTPAKTALKRDRFAILDGEVVDRETGETIPWATVTAASEGLTVRLDDEAKELAAGLIVGDAAALVAGFDQFLDEARNAPALETTEPEPAAEPAIFGPMPDPIPEVDGYAKAWNRIRHLIGDYAVERGNGYNRTTYTLPHEAADLGLSRLELLALATGERSNPAPFGFEVRGLTVAVYTD